jgi:hypothetical protein
VYRIKKLESGQGPTMGCRVIDDDGGVNDDDDDDDDDDRRDIAMETAESKLTNIP